ncbi:uncharacterized protein LOC142235029 [Haematobia irritans]|uniref:uncharacterized protein LOC142235029 n=1 Tax=Haematobia irritans TaxID=7368 RepID=UPI003F4FC243
MSTLPFLLSVADELENLNSQSYMDDFGMGFHPHRQYYRTPTIQLSLPAGTEWMEPEASRHHSRYRSAFRYYGEPQNNLTSPAENDEEDNEEERCDSSAKESHDSAQTMSTSIATTSAAQKFVSALNSNRPNGDNNDRMDNSVKLYNLSKKCGKNYYRQPEPSTSSASLGAPPPLPPRSSTASSAAAASASATSATTSAKEKPSMSYRLHSTCLEGTNSSSEESLQKVTSSIEFLTCFLLKKSRVSNKSSSSGSGGPAGDSKKS